jgi:LemA protein
MRRFLLICFTALYLTSCGVNNIPTYDEDTTAKWSQVLNQYKRRADLVPNLVSTVQGFANHEKETLTAVIEARASATKMTVDASTLKDPAQFEQFQKSQDALSGALARLMVSVERYPDLKSDKHFLSLQSQLEGTENRITVARKDYIDSVQRYNTELRTFPGRLWKAILYSDMQPKPNFTQPEEVSEAPKVEFK